jgi:hypothetical protein
MICGIVQSTAAVIDVTCARPLSGTVVTLKTKQHLNLLELQIFKKSRETETTMEPTPGPTNEYLVKYGCACPSGWEAIDSEEECAVAVADKLPYIPYKGVSGWGSAPFGCIKIANRRTFFRESKAPPQWCNILLSVICRPAPTTNAPTPSPTDEPTKGPTPSPTVYPSPSPTEKPTPSAIKVNSYSLTSTYNGNYPAKNCFDGDMNTMCHGKNRRGDTLTAKLVRSTVVGRVRITNRKGCCQERIKNAEVRVDGKLCGTVQSTGNVIDVICPEGLSGTIVTLKTKNQFLNIMQLEMFHDREPKELKSKYPYVKSGTCESNGYHSIRDAKECRKIGAMFKKNFNFYTKQGRGAGYPTGCSWHRFGNVEFWENSNGNCDVNGHDGCFCTKTL